MVSECNVEGVDVMKPVIIFILALSLAALRLAYACGKLDGQIECSQAERRKDWIAECAATDKSYTECEILWLEKEKGK